MLARDGEKIGWLTFWWVIYLAVVVNTLLGLFFPRSLETFVGESAGVGCSGSSEARDVVWLKMVDKHHEIIEFDLAQDVDCDYWNEVWGDGRQAAVVADRHNLIRRLTVDGAPVLTHNDADMLNWVVAGCFVVMALWLAFCSWTYLRPKPALRK